MFNLLKIWTGLKPKQKDATEPTTPEPTPVSAPTQAAPASTQPAQKRTNQAGIDLVKSFEGLELSAYPDPASPLGKACTSANLRLRSFSKVKNWELMSGHPWTVGYGHTGVMPDGSKVSFDTKVTNDEATELLKKDLEFFEKGVDSLVKSKITENQFSALVSFAYNCGLENLKKSTLLKLVNAGDTQGASNEFLKWNKAGGAVMAGLTKRRTAERDLFLR